MFLCLIIQGPAGKDGLPGHPGQRGEPVSSLTHITHKNAEGFENPDVLSADTAIIQCVARCWWSQLFAHVLSSGFSGKDRTPRTYWCGGTSGELMSKISNLVHYIGHCVLVENHTKWIPLLLLVLGEHWRNWTSWRERSPRNCRTTWRAWITWCSWQRRGKGQISIFKQRYLSQYLKEQEHSSKFSCCV